MFQHGAAPARVGRGWRAGLKAACPSELLEFAGESRLF
jgi:hypothetical protein